MPLQIFFGDDEHTALEGPYIRVMKARKWLVITSALAILAGLGLYDQQATKSIVRIFGVPDDLLRKSLGAALLYLILTYAFLVSQLLSIYDLTLSERFSIRQKEEVEKARNEVIGLTTNKADAERRLSEGEASHEKSDVLNIQTEVWTWEQQLLVAQQRLKETLSQEPSHRWLYVRAEIAVDALRIGVPVISTLLGGWLLLHPVDGPSARRVVSPTAADSNSSTAVPKAQAEALPTNGSKPGVLRAPTAHSSP